MPVVPMRPSMPSRPAEVEARPDPIDLAMGLGLLYQKDSLSQIEVGPAFKGVDENAYFNPKDKSAGRELTPEQLHRAKAAEDPRNIYDDSGQIQDYDLADHGKPK